MNFRTHILAGSLVLAASLPLDALAGGISVPDFSSRAAGRAGAVAAVIDSPSAVFYNPANLAALPGIQLELGDQIPVLRFSYTPFDGETTKSKPSAVTPPWLNLSYNAGDVGFGDLAIGLGFGVSNGSTYGWPEDWVGRGEVQDISLIVFELTPAVAWRPHKLVAIGAGFRYMPSTVYLKRAVEFGTAADGSVEFAGSGAATGASAGLTLFPMDGLTFGLSWRSQADVVFEGESDFDFPPPFDTEAVDYGVAATLPLGNMVRAGVAYDVLPKKLNLSFDFEFQQWERYEALEIEFLDDAGNIVDVASSPRNSKNSFVLHFGGELAVSEALAVRAGYGYDRHTLPEEFVNPAPPDSNRHSASLGFSYNFGKVAGLEHLAVHGNFSNVFFEKRTTYTNMMRGTWEGGWPGGTAVYLVGLMVSAAIDGPSSAFAAAPAPEAPAAETTEPAIETTEPAIEPAAPAPAPEAPATETTEPATEPAAPAPAPEAPATELAPDAATPNSSTTVE